MQKEKKCVDCLSKKSTNPFKKKEGAIDPIFGGAHLLKHGGKCPASECAKKGLEKIGKAISSALSNVQISKEQREEIHAMVADKKAFGEKAEVMRQVVKALGGVLEVLQEYNIELPKCAEQIMEMKHRLEKIDECDGCPNQRNA